MLVCSVSAAWRVAAMQDTPWREARRRDFPGADEGTVAVLRERMAFAGNGQQWEAEQALSLTSVGGAERNVYTWLSKSHTCDRCGQVRWAGP